MRILVVGAGAIGGYFGGRLIEAGGDVTFLLRPRRAAQFETDGLVIKSSFGDIALRSPAHLLSHDIAAPFDVVVVSCKAYDLPETMESFAPAVGPGTAILPLLNGMRHIEQLAERFGDPRVLGGLCMISATVDASGAILHLNDIHSLVFGERDGTRSPRVEAIEALFSRARFKTRASTEILPEMWEKWVFIASLGAINTLMRATVGDIVTAGASDLASGVYAEACTIARLNGFAPREPAVVRAREILTAAGSSLTASLLKDIERGARTEGDHIVGDLLRRGVGPPDGASLLRIADAALRSYEVRRAREARPA